MFRPFDFNPHQQTFTLSPRQKSLQSSNVPMMLSLGLQVFKYILICELIHTNAFRQDILV